MDGQHNYEINLKKDDLFINLSSDDVYFISKQMDKWFRILLDDSYVPVSLPQRPQPAAAAPSPAPVPEVLPAAEPVLAQPPIPAETPVTSPALPPLEPVVAIPEPMPQPQPEPVVSPVVPQPEPQPEPVAAVVPTVDLPPLVPIQPQPEPQPQSVVQLVDPTKVQPVPVAPPAPQPALAVASVQPVASAPAPPKDDFEAVMDTVMRDLERPAVAERQPALVPGPVEELPPREPADLSLISSLADLCEQAHAGSSEDYLLLASYYLNQMEYQETFSLKRINSNLVKSGLTPVNHSVLEAILSKGYLAMVPDMTGTAEVSEYMITPQGLNVVNDLF